MTRPMPGPLEHNRYAQPHTWFADEVCALCRSLGRGYTWGKRLTDAECAAEYWRAEVGFMALDKVLRVGWSNRDPVANEAARADTWKRFMDAPHALEEA